MATSFDATARISLDIRSFAQGAQAVTKSGGQMEQIFKNLNTVLSNIVPIEKQQAAALRSSLQIYNQVSSAAKNYATAVQALQKGESAGANGAKLMAQAFAQLKSSLAGVQGLSEKEFQRVQRTVVLYERLAKVIQTLASAQKSMSSVTQAAISAQQKDEQAKRKSEETARKLAIEEQKLAIQREKLAQTAARIAQTEEKLAQSRQRVAAATQAASQSTVSFSGSTFALRNTIGELEQGFQSLFNVLKQIPTALAGAAISQEAAFAQVVRVVGEADSATANLLGRFQEIAQQAPISFEEVSRIGQLGAAIGISAQNLGDFTDTIVKFSLTTGVASEEATILLGRIAQMEDVPISEIDQLGSAILALGTASAATDQEILRVNASIATVSNLFGLTAQETAGLSAALATLQVRPELSRGALTRVFNDLGEAVSSGGTELKKLALVMGLTDDEVTKLFNNPATRGDFLLSFIQGLSNAAGAGGDVQGVLRELGVNAVRDIDVFSRLANNFDIVSESFDKANEEFARGTELQRQSKGIYNTTAAELQNLSDAFQTLLANLGGPIAKGLGGFASLIADKIIGPLAQLGPIIPIIGTLGGVAVTLAAGWALYQLVLTKSIQSIIAVRELQERLKVTTLNARLALDIYRNGFAGTIEAQTIAANSSRTLTASTESLAAALTVSSRAIQAQSLTAAASAQGLNAMGVATANAVRGQEALFTSTFATQNSMRALSLQASASALAMTAVSRANTNLALTQNQIASSSARFTGQTTLAAVSASALNTSSLKAVPSLNLMSNSMRQAAASGVQMGAGMDVAAVSSATAAGAFSRATTGITAAGAAARVASVAFGPWGIGIATVGLLLGPLVADMGLFTAESDKIASSALESSGGIDALSNAIKADTDAAIRAAGGVEQYNTAIRNGSDAALNAIGAYRTITTTKSDLAEADRKSAESAREAAEQTIRAIEATKGSEEELRKQAEGHGQGAEAARRYLREIEAANKTVEQSTKVLGENTAAIGENVKQWLQDTAQAAVESSKIADGSKTSTEALKQLSEAGVDVGNVLTESLTSPEGATKKLDAAIKILKATMEEEVRGGGMLNSGPQLNETGKAASRAKDLLEALKTTIAAEDSESTKLNITQGLLADALDDTSQSASSASGKIKLTKEALEDLDVTGEEAQTAIDNLADQFAKFGTPFDAFKKAAENAFGGATDAVDKFSLQSKSGLNSYLKELEKIAKAQREWSANLIKISTTLGPDIAEQFRKLGPEAAPAVAELADLSAAELAKLGPRLKEIAGDATSDLAAGIIANSGEIKNASLQTKTVIADIFGNVIDKAKTSEDFADVSTQYQKLLTQLNSLKGVTIDISADDAKALKSLNDVSLFIDLVGKKKVSPDIAIDIVKAQGDITKLQELLKNTNLNKEGKATLDTLLFQAQLAQLTTSLDALEAEGKLDAKGEGKLSDEAYRAKVLALTEFLASSEGQGLLNPKGKAQLDDKAYRAQMEALANTILGEEQAGKFDVNGDGKLDDDEFKALLEALKKAVASANKGQLDPKGTVTLAGTGNFNRQLGGIVQAAQTAGSRITTALTRSATVSVGYHYYQKNSPPKSMNVATGGWINGPGGPKSDVIPAMLSNGEFVVNAAAARRFGSLLEVINRSGGRGFSGVAKRLLDAGTTGGNKQVRLSASGGQSVFGQNVVQQAPPESVSVFASRMAVPQQGPTNVFNITNQYPQAEPTSVTVNRSLAYAATISGV